MEDKNKSTEEVLKNPKSGSGSMLAAARKQQNRSVEEIADELNLSVTQIRTIELDQSEGLPEPTYVRGYIRSYAKLLGLDPAEVLDNYLNPNWQRGSRLDEMPRGIGSANESDRRGFGFFSPVKVVTTLLLLSVVGFLWLTGKFDGLIGSQDQRPVGLATLPAPTTALSSSESQVIETLESTTTAADSSANDDSLVGQSLTLDQSSRASGDEAPVTLDQSVAASSENAVASSQNAAAPDGVSVSSQPDVTKVGSATEDVHNLTLNFSDTCWVDIRDSDGQRLAYKSYSQGQVLKVSSAIRINVFLGNAKVVTAEYNGQDYDLAPYREGVFARFSFGE